MDGGRVAAVEFVRGSAKDGERFEVACDRLVVADGVRSPLGKLLGREWHRETVYGVAGRSYADSTMSDDPWISSHLELRDEQGAGAVGVRLDLPARQRRGERRRRHPGHGQAARRDRDQAADGALRRAAAGGLRARRRAADAHLGAAADGRRGLGRGRRQLGADRRRRRVREPAQRRGHRLRPGVRPAPGGDDGGARRPRRAPGRRCCASTTARRSRSPAASPAW